MLMTLRNASLSHDPRAADKPLYYIVLYTLYGVISVYIHGRNHNEGPGDLLSLDIEGESGCGIHSEKALGVAREFLNILQVG